MICPKVAVGVILRNVFAAVREFFKFCNSFYISQFSVNIEIITTYSIGCDNFIISF